MSSRLRVRGNLGTLEVDPVPQFHCGKRCEEHGRGVNGDWVTQASDRSSGENISNSVQSSGDGVEEASSTELESAEMRIMQVEDLPIL
eukprot:228996-Hanusia_phi.AAC.2